jgi:phage shock protein A
MSLFSRLGAIIRGFFGLFVGRVEDKNPEALFEDVKNQIERERKDAEQRIVEIQTNAEMIKIEMRNAERNLSAVRSRIEAAQRQGDKEMLVELLVQEEEYQTTFETTKATYDSAMADVAKVRDDYKLFESEMNAKLNELKTLKSQAKMAQLKENINSVNAKYTSKNSRIGNLNENLDRAREIVNMKTARANAVESLNDNNVDLKLRKLDMNSARDRARARAEAMLSGDQGFEVKEKIDNKANQ